ncbi:glycosyltransferase family 2 protein [Roseobacter sp. YSTF-M11]|uniref:Glycosyltransferase family 2 protein n=1 Tax=Roseobacter insulae TaxID=2859783 RepID=A0A9X1FW53_9RHOB|nr:glycosyltransferase family 2 protein [Roseobacter insulae]MBW4707978.1 glycosyltransferase family 2 protein [Roseobacter insulae]
MRICLHIGLCGSDRIQNILADKRGRLLKDRVLFAQSPGNKNHTRLFMAVTDPGHVDPLRYNRGLETPEKQALMAESLRDQLAAEIDTHKPHTLILSCRQLAGSLWRTSEVARLKEMLSRFSDDIRIVAFVDEPATMLSDHYAHQVIAGRAVSLARDLALVEAADWWQSCLDTMPRIDAAAGVFEEVQGAPFWLDFKALVSHWDAVFGDGATRLHHHSAADFAAEHVGDDIARAFALTTSLGAIAATRGPPPPPDATLTRARLLNELVLRLLQTGDHVLPRQVWQSFVRDIHVAGPPIDPARLSAVSKRFRTANRQLVKAHGGLTDATFKAPRAKSAWQEAEPLFGYRASQYLLAFMWKIEKATQQARRPERHDPDQISKPPTGPTDAAAPNPVLPPLALQQLEKLRTSPMAPHNRLGAVNEAELAAAYSPAAPRRLAKGSTGNVIVGCMKNEAPYIVEWVAYHRAIGIDNFLIYTNDCSDGTSEILDRLDAMGVLTHRNNDNWKGNSPQQYALNQALKEPVIRNAEWIVHIDVDEFMNIRCGNGTVQDFIDRVPDATNIAMTWRLFGHNGVSRLRDELVIDQFDTCAPKYCPKPHTVWGFKTMFRNIGAYEKISCHRPNKLSEPFEDKVKWVNGSGMDMTREVARNGWRSSRKSIGYDLIQLNHYALRSAESFLIKRQRGRALHVDRSIGLNYWIRMDWSDFRDITIKRNIPRVQAERARLMADPQLNKLHRDGFEWHQAKAAELQEVPEFADLYKQAVALKLTETERVAFALALDTES